VCEREGGRGGNEGPLLEGYGDWGRDGMVVYWRRGVLRFGGGSDEGVRRWVGGSSVSMGRQIDGGRGKGGESVCTRPKLSLQLLL